jgi:flagellar motor component MotA
MLFVLDNREMLGPNLAVSLIMLIYAIAISFFVFFPTQAWVENQYNALSAGE